MVPNRRKGGLSGSSSAPRAHSSQRTTPTPAEAPAPDPQQGGEEVAKDMAELVSGLEAERDEYLELARRTKADFENYRKRVDREAALAESRGRARLARDLLSVLDNLERALAAAEPVDHEAVPSHLAEGVRLVYEELAGILSNAGIESFEPEGELFDPEFHEAMMTRPATAEEAGKVLEVLQKGYRLNGEMLRPARVVVGAAEEA